MLILTIRTDKPEAEIGLFEDNAQLSYHAWQAHRELGQTIHTTITKVLAEQQKTLNDIEGIVAFQGPGSFTGLRIGLSVANALADGYGIPIVGTMSDEWIAQGCEKLRQDQNDRVVMPEYGAPVHITAPKK
jgi:tRNA threonylcarbamoyladenosine biosynthesis protein TsaB